MIELRKAVLEDAKFLVNLRNNPEIFRWFRQDEELTIQQQKDWMEKNLNESNLMFIVEEPSLGKIGFCSLTHIDNKNKRAEFSIGILPHYKGLGLGRKTLEKLIEFGFSTLNLEKITSDVFDGNPALELYKRLAFIEEGRLARHYFKQGRWIDAIIMSKFK